MDLLGRGKLLQAQVLVGGYESSQAPRTWLPMGTGTTLGWGRGMRLATGKCSMKKLKALWSMCCRRNWEGAVKVISSPGGPAKALGL